MRQLIVIPILITTLCSCGQENKVTQEYPLQVGDINFNPKQDDPNFKLCDETRVLQYYNFGKGVQYKGEKLAIDKYFEEGLRTKGTTDDTGFLTIRFVVNCEGKPGRFRVQGMDNSYNEKEFSKTLTGKLLELTSQMMGWIIGEHEGKTYDYYQYLTFKVESGNLIEIMP